MNIFKKKEPPSRITITERGRAFQKEIAKELKLEKSFRSSHSGGRANNSVSPVHLGTQNSSRELNQATRRYDPISTSLPDGPIPSLLYNSKTGRSSRDGDHIKLPKIDFKPELQRNDYVKKKLDKLNNDISKLETRSESKTKLHTKSLPYFVPSEYSYASSNNYDQSLNNQLSVRHDLGDKFMVKHYVKMLHAESEIETLLKRHEKNLAIRKRIQDDVEKKYRKMKYFEDEENHKPPTFLDQIKGKHPEAIEALQRKTNYFNRRKLRIKEEERDRYHRIWNNFQDLSKKK